MILILDIDETLVHSTHDEMTPNSFRVLDYTVEKRPYVDEFLAHILNDDYYEVGIWSAGTYEYVHAIVNELIKDRANLRFILTQRDCNELYDKPLSKVRDLINEDASPDYPYTVHDFLIIDNKKGVTGHDHLNHLHIEDFYGDSDDVELYHLWEYLDKNRYYTSEYLCTKWK